MGSMSMVGRPIKKIFLAICSVFILNTTEAQLEKAHIPPSPNAAAIVGSANVDVGHYNGVANISVPIHNLMGKGISIPISLDYNASGIRVQDVSTSVGLGWSLNAAGFAVTRVVRGFPDGQVPPCGLDGSGKVGKNYIYWTDQLESCDSERDIFYFSLPGRKGKMFLGTDNLPKTMPYQDLEISPGVGPASIGYWKIVDESGYTYHFGENGSSQEQSTYSIGDHVTNVFTQKHTYISTWYLTKIESPTGVVVSTFGYTPGAEVTYYNYGVRVKNCLSVNIPFKRVDLKIKISSPKYISSIGTDLTSCVFSYDNNRADVAGALRLSLITIKDASAVEKKKFYLEGGCFLDYPASFGICRRLKLNSIKEGLSNPVTTHTFIYNETNLLPPENSYLTDHYGFYNWDNTDLPGHFNAGLGYEYISVPTVPGCTMGRSKFPNFVGALALILKEIQYSSGGRSLFTYDANGMARITNVSQYDGTTLVAQSTFSYGGGQSYKTPVYHYYDTQAEPDLLIRSSNSYNSIYDLNGVVIGYSTVTETLLDGSKIIRTFENFTNYPDEAPIVGRYSASVNGSWTYLSASHIDSSPFTPHTSKAWMRGLPKSMEIRDNLNNLLQKHDYQYILGSLISTAWNMAVELYSMEPGNHQFYVGEYMLRSQHVYLDNETVYSYDQADLNRVTAAKTTYTYHSSLRTFPISVQTKFGTAGPELNPDRPEQKITFRYPIDVAGTGPAPTTSQQRAEGIWSLISNHVIVPVEKLIYYKEIGSTFKITGGELSTFRKNPVKNKPFQMEMYTLDLLDPVASISPATLTSSGTVFSYDNSKYRLIESYSYDDTNVRLNSVSNSEGITQQYEWDYNNSAIKGAYTMLGSTQYKTQYAYNTVYGLSTITDPNNRVSRFEYDNFGRLKLIKDTENNVVTHYRYNSKNIAEFTVDYSVGSKLSGTPVSFTLIHNAETAGITRYVWDFGDGQVLETSSTSVTHTYPNTGTYITKLSKINPEYGTVMATKSISIVPPIVAPITGPGSINLCVASSSFNLSINSATGGCAGTKTYSWTVTDPAGTTTVIGTSSTIGYNVGSVTGNYAFKCTVTDSCGNWTIVTHNVSVYKQGGC